jgi:hypothetical protein
MQRRDQRGGVTLWSERHCEREPARLRFLKVKPFMPPGWIAAVCDYRPTRRQVARALSSGGFEPRFFAGTELALFDFSQDAPALVMLDADNLGRAAVEPLLRHVEGSRKHIPVVLLSVAANKSALLELLQQHEIGNLIAKHGAIRATFPVLDERELLVTCLKVVKNDVFGLEKYIGSWGIELRSRQVRDLADKRAVCDEFEAFVTGLDAPKTVVPSLIMRPTS